MERKGIDVSYAQGVIDWARVKAAGIDFAIIRSSYRTTGQDRFFAANLAGCEAQGIPYGFYHYSYAVTVEEAKLEALFCIKTICKAKPTYPVWFDFEEVAQKQLDLGLQMRIIEAFITTMQEYGYKSGLYSFLSMLLPLRRAFPERMDALDIWNAQWAAKSAYPVQVGMWQHSNKGRVDGINADVDLDTSYKDYDVPAHFVIPASPKKAVVKKPRPSKGSNRTTK